MRSAALYCTLSVCVSGGGTDCQREKAAKNRFQSSFFCVFAPHQRFPVNNEWNIRHSPSSLYVNAFVCVHDVRAGEMIAVCTCVRSVLFYTPMWYVLHAAITLLMHNEQKCMYIGCACNMHCIWLAGCSCMRAPYAKIVVHSALQHLCATLAATTNSRTQPTHPPSSHHHSSWSTHTHTTQNADCIQKKKKLNRKIYIQQNSVEKWLKWHRTYSKQIIYWREM